jgi:hypothetical protein
VIEMLLGAGALAVAVLVFAHRNEAEIVRIWSQLVSPAAEGFRRSVDTRVAGQDRLLAARQARARDAERSGDVLEAARLGELEREAREEGRVLNLMRRMLSALRAR